MDLLNPYLRAQEYWKAFLDGPSTGLLVFNSLRFSGPPADRSKWVFNAGGSVEDVVVQTMRLNSPLTLKTGAFEINGENLALREISTVLADSSLVISGTVTGYPDRVRNVDLRLSGRLGPEGNKIAASLAGLPNSLRAIANLNLDNSRLTWDKGSKTAFQGEMSSRRAPDCDQSGQDAPGTLHRGPHHKRSGFGRHHFHEFGAESAQDQVFRNAQQQNG